MKKLLLLASAAVFVYAAFTRFGKSEDSEEVQMSVPVWMDRPVTMSVIGGTYADNITDTYYESYMRSLVDTLSYIPELVAP